LEERIQSYLKNLKEYGIKNDIPNVTEKVGRFLNLMIRIKEPRNILEIGCANGYSAIWMAEAVSKAKVGVRIHAIDHSKPTFEEAKKNLSEIGLDKFVKFYFGDAIDMIENMDSKQMFDFVFVDGEKKSYLDFWNVIQPHLTAHAVVVFDNMVAFPEKTKEFSETIKSVTGFDQILLPTDEDDGILLLIKN
jgi:predicted O-methyltransferase YrrM